MSLKKNTFILFFLLFSINIFSINLNEGYIAMELNKVFKYDFAKVYIDDDFEVVYVNAEELIELMELSDVKVSKKEKTIKGYIDKRYLIEKKDRIINWTGNNENTKIDENDDLYVDFRELKDIFGVSKIDFNPSQMILTINFSFMTAVELKMQNEKDRQIKTLNFQDEELDGLIVERPIFTPGFLTFSFNWDDFSKNNQSLSYVYNSMFLYGELSISGSLYEESNINFYRLDYDNLLDGKIVSIGKTSLFDAPNLYRGGSSIDGISINRKSINYTTNKVNDTETIEGFAPVRSVVELYQNDFLIDFKDTEEDGFFQFQGIEERSPSDTYTIKIYDERGFLVETRTYQSIFETDFLNKNEFDYQLALGQSDNQEAVGSLDIYYGIFDRLTYNTGVYISNDVPGTVIDEKEEFFGERVVKNSLIYRSPKITYPYYLKGSYYQDIDNIERVFDGEYVQKLFWQTELNYLYRKNYHKMSKLLDYSDRHQISLSWGLGSFYSKLSYKNIKREEEKIREEDYKLLLSYRINSKTRVSFEDQYNVNLDEHLASIGVNYNFTSTINSSLTFEKTFNKPYDSYITRFNITKSPDRSISNLSLNGGLQYSKVGNNSDWTYFLGFNYYFGRGAIKGSQRRDEDPVFGLSYVYTMNLAKPLEYNASGSNNDSWVEGQMFIDNNSNGIYDLGDEPLSNVVVKGGNAQGKTDENGYYYIGGFPSKKMTELKFSYDNLDPDQVLLNDNSNIKLYPTDGVNYNLPLVRASGLMGYIKFDESIELNNRNKELIFARSRIQVFNLKDELIEEVPIEMGGFYIIDGIKPGNYIIKLNYLGAKDLELKENSLKLNVDPSTGNGFYELDDFLIKKYN